VTLLKSLLTQRALRKLAQALGTTLTQHNIALKIDSDLSVQGMRPYLHLPMLAGIMQGPGFANLSCLGRLSDRLVTSFMYERSQTSHQQIFPFLQEARSS
jgi:mycobactin lysine-N-oxygenase